VGGASPVDWSSGLDGDRARRPRTTPPEQLRFDAALAVPGPFAPEGRIGHQFLRGGHFAVTTHAGLYQTLPAAYAAIFPRIMALSNYQAVGLPVIETYHTAKVSVRYQINHTDICLPVLPRDLE
jgi:AraC family transcriptional regulator